MELPGRGPGFHRLATEGARTMYVLCVGMYRACSTWQYEVAAHLLEAHRGGRRLGYLTGDEFADHDHAEGSPRDGWSLLKSHEEHPGFQKAMSEGRALALYSYRDLRDVVYSLMHKRQQSFDTLLARGMVHQILANDRFWTARSPVLVQRYEALIADPAAGVEQLARFLGIELAAGEADEVAAQYSLQANRQRTDELGRRLRQLGVDLHDPSNAQHADRQTLLHWNHLREGRAGSWREQATPRERRLLARLSNSWLDSHGYEIDVVPAAEDAPRSLSGTIRDTWLVARGWLSCRLRCAALRHPRTARRIKAALGVGPAPRPHATGLPEMPRAAVASPHTPNPEPARRADAA